MKSRSNDAVWMGSAFCAALALAVGLMIICGVGEGGIAVALRATARFQFLLFWLAYSGSALASLFGPAFLPLKQRVREFGLAFSAALLVHLGLVGLLCLFAPPAVEVFIFFGGAAACAYLLALFSIPRLHQALNSKYWWLLSNIGMNCLAYAFFRDFRNEPFHGGIKHVIEYFPFVALAVAGPMLRLAAFAQGVRRKRKAPSGERREDLVVEGQTAALKAQVAVIQEKRRQSHCPTS